jgi:hypothetical protein
MNKVIARYADGDMTKGVTADFFPNKETFHVSVEGAGNGAPPVLVSTKDLKALFFVKDFAGNPEHVESNQFDAGHPAAGRRIKVTFRDGEVLIGTTTGYQRGRPGFFIVPADRGSNIERCYVVTAATEAVEFV